MHLQNLLKKGSISKHCCYFTENHSMSLRVWESTAPSWYQLTGLSVCDCLIWHLTRWTVESRAVFCPVSFQIENIPPLYWSPISRYQFMPFPASFLLCCLDKLYKPSGIYLACWPAIKLLSWLHRPTAFYMYLNWLAPKKHLLYWSEQVK